MSPRQQRKRGFPPAIWTEGEVPFREGKDYEIDPATGCWVWQCYIDPRGYGRCQRVQFTAATGSSIAHRQVWMALHGRIPRDVDVHHLCRNTRCINPDHLEAKPKVTHLEDHCHAVSPLDEEDVFHIRWAAWDREPIGILGQWYGVATETIYHIVEGINWKGAPGPIGKPPCAECLQPVARRSRNLCPSCEAKAQVAA